MSDSEVSRYPSLSLCALLCHSLSVYVSTDSCLSPQLLRVRSWRSTQVTAGTVKSRFYRRPNRYPGYFYSRRRTLGLFSATSAYIGGETWTYGLDPAALARENYVYKKLKENQNDLSDSSSHGCRLRCKHSRCQTRRALRLDQLVEMGRLPFYI